MFGRTTAVSRGLQEVGWGFGAACGVTGFTGMLGYTMLAYKRTLSFQKAAGRWCFCFYSKGFDAFRLFLCFGRYSGFVLEVLIMDCAATEVILLWRYSVL